VHIARFLAGAADPAHLPTLSYPEIAFAGRSNVGKSSLLNRLVGQRKLARVSKTPGRTQQINFFLIDERLTFVDLPGYGFARVPLSVQQHWKHLVETYLSTRRNLRGVVIIVDLRRGVEADDAQLLEYLHANHIAAILVATKADKLAYGARQRRSYEVRQALAYPVAALAICSAGSGEGIGELWTAIATMLQGPRRSRERGEPRT
jgi:GTP-binding protein